MSPCNHDGPASSQVRSSPSWVDARATTRAAIVARGAFAAGDDFVGRQLVAHGRSKSLPMIMRMMDAKRRA